MTEHKIAVSAGLHMHYREEGEGDPILFLHGIPASSYVWRNIIPCLSGLGRCIAPDLMGFGESDKPDIAYTIEDYIENFGKFITELGLENIILVVHGFGSIIGLAYAMRYPEKFKGLVFYEAYLREISPETTSLPYQEYCLSLQKIDISQNGMAFVDEVLKQTTLNLLNKKDIAIYQAPFSKSGSQKPLLQYIEYIKKILASTHNPINEYIAEYSEKLMRSNIPKLLLYSLPGFITQISTIEWAKKHLPHGEVAEIGEALHYAQEMNPRLMGETISIWLQGLG